MSFREYLFDGVGQRFAGSLFRFFKIDHIPDFAEHGRNGNAPSYRRIALSGFLRLAGYKGAAVFVFDPHRSEFSSAHTGIEQHQQRVYSYDEIGIIPTKLFIGVCCSEKHKKELIDIANKLNIPYELCTVRDEEKFSVLSSK